MSNESGKIKESNAEDKTLLVLEVLKEEFSLGTDNNSIDIASSKFEAGGLDIYSIRRLLNKFVDQKIIREVLFLDEKEAQYGEEYDYDVWRVAFPKNFLDIYRKFLSDNFVDKIKESEGKVVLYIDEVGNLWREPRNIYFYEMGANSDRFKMLKFLVENNGYQSSDSISNFLNGKDKTQVRNEINKVKANIKKFLSIPDLIESKKDSGYRINPSYHIQER